MPQPVGLHLYFWRDRWILPYPGRLDGIGLSCHAEPVAVIAIDRLTELRDVLLDRLRAQEVPVPRTFEVPWPPTPVLKYIDGKTWGAFERITFQWAISPVAGGYRVMELQKDGRGSSGIPWSAVLVAAPHGSMEAANGILEAVVAMSPMVGFTSMKPEHYDPHPSLAMARTILQNLEQKTGRSAEEWVALVQQNAPPAKKDRVAWLKKEHGLGLNYATWIATQATDGDAETGDPETYLRKAQEYVDALYAGQK